MIDLEQIDFKNKAILAPLAGFSDVAFRSLAAMYGACYTHTEMVSAKGLFYNSEKTKDLLRTDKHEKIKAVQLFGSESKYIVFAIKSKFLDDFDIIDLNMGCPVNKVFSNNEGSALLNQQDLIYDIVSNAVKAADGRIVSVKIRKGIKRDEDLSLKNLKVIEDAGAKIVTLHARTREEFYQGKADRGCIKRAVESAKKAIIVANGDVYSKDDYFAIKNETGAKAVMIARGALGNPGIFADISGNAKLANKKEEMKYYLEYLAGIYPEDCVHHMIKTQLSYFVKSSKNSKRIRNEICMSKSLDEIREIIRKEDI